jgi:hypothetical protein
VSRKPKPHLQLKQEKKLFSPLSFNLIIIIFKFQLPLKTAKGFNVTGKMAIYIGHKEGSNTYKCYVPEINDIVMTEDIRFQEAAIDVFEAQSTPIESDSEEDFQ